ncbi:glycosyltransferase family 4 protein [Geomonas propionica]|uniref:Glycosyltransferase family 4 protein n=1 Tax=Geomonas propionica TaxID=2798582 RepID=A0ABS0YWY8_9BACT|nr:glycosyltransferase family 4 protein [Geomonas propionica]MBJ6802449.1 glycosyltransferase family 4 protein [Geomonas propionica]
MRNCSLKGKSIVLAFGSLDMGGAERQGLYLARALQETWGARVVVLGLSARQGRVSELCDQRGLQWRGFDFNWGKTAPTRLFNLVRLARELRSLTPDVILSYTAIPNLACGNVWRSTGARLFVWNQRDEGLLLNRKLWHRRAVSSTDFFIANSGNAKSFLIDTYPLGGKRIEVVHNGVEECLPQGSREEWRARLDIAADRLVGCMVANFHPFKDHATLIKAWAEVVAGSGEPTAAPILLLAGRNDVGEENLRQLVQDLKLVPYVRFLGRVDDVAGLLRASDLCLHSSKSEGLPNAVLESMAAGCPVVGTDIPGVREALGDDVDESLVPVGNCDAFADRIRRVFGDPDLRQRMVLRQRERVALNFSLDGMCNRSAALLSGWLEGAEPATQAAKAGVKS